MSVVNYLIWKPPGPPFHRDKTILPDECVFMITVCHLLCSADLIRVKGQWMQWVDLLLQLARIQTDSVAETLKELYPDIHLEIGKKAAPLSVQRFCSVSMFLFRVNRLHTCSYSLSLKIESESVHAVTPSSPHWTHWSLCLCSKQLVTSCVSRKRHWTWTRAAVQLDCSCAFSHRWKLKTRNYWKKEIHHLT